MDEGTAGRKVGARAVIALLCLVMALAFGISDRRGDLADLNHQLHGDVAASDGGWLVADCGASEDPCGNGGLDGDGHHHHAADHASAYALTLSPGVAAPFRVALTKAAPRPSDRFSDADLSRPGPVPRISHGLI